MSLRSVPFHVAIADEVRPTIELKCDSRQTQADIQLLAQAAQRSMQVRQRLIDLVDFAPELVRFDTDHSLATAACELRIRLELSDALLELVAAIRAGQFDGLVVEDACHG
jgi:hypothetical protein